jgi:hypothetical protein
MKLTERINFRQPKYMLPAIVYLPLLGASYFIFDLFDTKVAEKKDANMQTTEYLNPNLPQAHIKGGDGIGGKYENMLNAYGKIEDHSAVENIDRDNEQEKEEYQSKYSDAELQISAHGLQPCQFCTSWQTFFQLSRLAHSVPCILGRPCRASSPQ